MAKPKNIAPIVLGATTAVMLAYAVGIGFLSPFSPVTKCKLAAGSEYVIYSTAATWIQNYEQASNNDPTLVARYEDYAKGDNVSDCIIKILRRQITKKPYKKSHGIQIRYGLVNQNDDRDTQRIGILLPMESDGTSEALVQDRKVYTFTFPPNFQDPCPPHCDQ